MTKCVEWSGARTSKGYGQKSGVVRGKWVYVHRWAWEQAHGPIPPGMLVLHKCDNPPCYNVEHLFIGTQADNSLDMVRKGRSSGRSLTPSLRALVSIALMHWRGSQRRLAAAIGVSRPSINKVLRGCR